MNKRLFVGNLSFDISESELQEAFASYGSTGATIPTSESGRPKGFGFVDVPGDQASAAIANMDGKELGGRTIAVNEAKPRPEVAHWGTSGGRGGYGGGGGRGGYGGGGGGGRGGYGGGRR
jgi:RNA recognition motif-containing protein